MSKKDAFTKNLIHGPKEEFFHSSAYGIAQSGTTMGTASTEAFAKRQKMEKNRKIIHKYNDSRVAAQRFNHDLHPQEYTGENWGTQANQDNAQIGQNAQNSAFGANNAISGAQNPTGAGTAQNGTSYASRGSNATNNANNPQNTPRNSATSVNSLQTAKDQALARARYNTGKAMRSLPDTYGPNAIGQGFHGSATSYGEKSTSHQSGNRSTSFSAHSSSTPSVRPSTRPSIKPQIHPNFH